MYRLGSGGNLELRFNINTVNHVDEGILKSQAEDVSYGYEFQINYDDTKKPIFRSDRYQSRW